MLWLQKIALFTISNLLCFIASANQLSIERTPLGWKEFRPSGGNWVQVISLVSLIAHPEKYEGKRVAIKGFFSMEVEDTRIYMSKDFYEYRQAEYAVLVDLDNQKKDMSISMTGKFVRIEGVFRKYDDRDGSVGFLEDVTRLEAFDAAPSRRVK